MAPMAEKAEIPGIPDLERLRAAYATLAPAPGHLEPADWEALISRASSGPEREAHLEHLVRCPECTRTWKALLALAEEAQALDPTLAAPRQRRATPAALWLGVGAAAATVAAVLLLPILRPNHAERAPGGDLRSGGAAQLVALTPAGVQEKRPDTFHWKPFAGADAFRVHLFSEEGLPVWTSPPAPALEVALPAEIQLQPGVYHWWVEATRAGERVGASPLRVFELRDGGGSRPD